MIRKTIIVVLTLGAVLTVAVEVFSKAQPCRLREQWGDPCPVLLYLGRSSDRGSYRFVYAVSGSWYSSVGYFSWKSRTTEDRIYEDGEMFIHAICWGTMDHPNERILRVVRVDTVPPYDIFQRGLLVPRGFFFFTFAAYPTIALIRGPLRRWRRRRKGLCIRCGYNLEGNVSGVCSECGEAVERTENIETTEVE